MQLLVTTSRSVLLMDPDTGAAEVIERGRGLYYGVTFSADQIYRMRRKTSPFRAEI